MRTRKRVPPPSEPSRDVSERISIDVVLDGSTSAYHALTLAERTVLRSIESDIAKASMCGEFDLRHMLPLEGAARLAWLERREAWIRELLDGDRRVEQS